jgi:formylglycine-generating enzyme required for sulfatase activity
MKLRSSRTSLWFELPALLTLLTLAALLVATPHSIAQQEHRQLKREQTQLNGTMQRRLALVIGNGAYTTVPPLKNPPNDAALLAATLRKLGFEVTIGTNRSQREMKQLIREFGQRLRGEGGVGLFYFAGHGVQARGRNYLIPVDADIQTEADLEDVAVDVNYVLNMMDDAQNALNIAILDACRNNPFARSFRSAQDGLAQVKAPTGTLIAYATSPDSVAADGGGANSPYAEELTKQIQVSGVLLETMFRRVAEQVSSRSGGRQEPWYSANVKGDFYFSASPTNSSSSSTADITQPARIDSVAVEREYWETIRDSSDAQDYKDYLQSYPSGAYIAIARAKIKRLETVKNRLPNTGPVDSGGNVATPSKGVENSNAVRPKSFKNRQGIEMVYIPPGEFSMGSANGELDEKPVHNVTIAQGFFMGKYEVTQAQWQVVMGNNPSYFKDCGGNCPVEPISWHDAQDFISKLNDTNDGFKYRLPSEAEWEYACRAGSTEDYSSADVDEIGWYSHNSGKRTRAVGQRQPNAFGLYDMSGNLWEWCHDLYHDSYKSAPPDGSVWQDGDSTYRVVRGGSWNSQASLLRSASRDRNSPNSRFSSYGFRVVAVTRTH